MDKLKKEANVLLEKANELHNQANMKLLKKLKLPEIEQKRGQKEHITYDRMAWFWSMRDWMTEIAKNNKSGILKKGGK